MQIINETFRGTVIPNSLLDYKLQVVLCVGGVDSIRFVGGQYAEDLIGR